MAEETKGATGTAPSDDAPQPTKAELKEMQTEAQVSYDRGYTIGEWSGVPMYKSVFDEFDTTNLEEMEEYVKNHRNGLGVYGRTSNQQLTPAQKMNARQRGKPKA